MPYTIEETVREAKAAYDAGASIIHLHVRLDDGTPTQDTARFQTATDAIRAVCPGGDHPAFDGGIGQHDRPGTPGIDQRRTGAGTGDTGLRYLQFRAEMTFSSTRTIPLLILPGS